MNEKKSVYKTLFLKSEKTELETHKVELNVQKEIQSLLSEIKKTEALADKVKNGVEQKKDAYNNELEKVDFLYADLQALEREVDAKLEKVEAMAKDLGVDASGVKGYRELEGSKRFIPSALKFFKAIPTLK